MKQNTRKILTLSVLALFVLVFALQFVAAADAVGTTGVGADVTENIFSSIKSAFADWEGGTEFDTAILKYLLWALVSMMVYSIVGKIPGLSNMFAGDNKWIGAVFSIVVGFLSMTFIIPAEIKAIMISYSALGFTLGGALPFIILLFFTITLITEGVNKGASYRYGSRIIAIAMWIAFTIFVGYKALAGRSIDVGYLYWITFVAGIAVVLSMKALQKNITKSMNKEKREKAGETSEDATATVKRQAKETETLSK